MTNQSRQIKVSFFVLRGYTFFFLQNRLIFLEMKERLIVNKRQQKKNVNIRKVVHNEILIEKKLTLGNYFKNIKQILSEVMFRKSNVILQS